MAEKTLFCAVILFAISVVIIGCGEDEVLVELEHEVDNLQSEISGLQNTISLLDTKAEYAGQENERIAAEIDAIQEAIDELKSAEYVDPKVVTQLEERLDQVKTDASGNGEDISQLDTKVTTLESGLNSNATLISQIRGETDALDIGLRNNEADTAGLVSQVDGLDIRISTNENAIGVIDGQISGVIDGSTIAATEIRLVDEDGKLQAKLYTSLLGNPFLSFYDENGIQRMDVGTFFGDSTIWMYDENENTLADIGTWLGSPYLYFYDENGEVITSLDESSVSTFLISQELLSFHDEEGPLGIMFAVSPDDKPMLIYMDSNGEFWSVPLERVLESQGSGFLLSESGLVVTNNHVIEDRSDIEVVFPLAARSLAAEIVLQDEINDLAILRLINFRYSDVSSTDIPYQIAPSSIVNSGENVVTVGFPLAYTLGESPRVSEGIINSIYGIANDPTVFQISNPVQPGNSGGPLFNNDGQLVGIVVATLSAAGDEFIPQNVNFAIKSKYLIDLIHNLPNEDEVNEIMDRSNELFGKSLEEQVEMLTPFVVVVKAR